MVFSIYFVYRIACLISNGQLALQIRQFITIQQQQQHKKERHQRKK